MRGVWLSLATFDQMIAQEVQKPCQPQRAIDDYTAASDGIVNAEIEHPREQLNQLFHIGPGTVDTPSDAGSMQHSNQLHHIIRRKLFRKIKRIFWDLARDRAGNKRIAKPDRN